MRGRRGRGFKRRRRFRKKGGVRRLVKRVRRIEKSIETKQIFAGVAAQQYYMPDIGTFISQTFLLNGLAGGSDVSERVGEKVVWTSMDIAFFCEADNDGAAFKTQQVRILLYWDRQCNGEGPPDLGYLLEIANTAAPLPRECWSQRQWENRKRFRMIKDKFITLRYMGTTGGQNFLDTQSRLWRKHIKLGRTPTMYQGTGASVVSVNRNALFCTIISNVPESNTHGPYVDFNARLRYQDL